jgi:hypothetical protein
MMQPFCRLPARRRTFVFEDSGGHGVSLDEALALAAALGIAPVHLFVPREDHAQVEIVPCLVVSALQARAWLRGQEPLPGMDEKTYRIELPDSEWKQTQQPSPKEREARAALDRAT